MSCPSDDFRTALDAAIRMSGMRYGKVADGIRISRASLCDIIHGRRRFRPNNAKRASHYVAEQLKAQIARKRQEIAELQFAGKALMTAYHEMYEKEE